MNLCKIGIHDYVNKSVRSEVFNELIDYLNTFEHFEKHNDDGWISYKNEKFSIPSFTMRSMGILGLEGCIPYECIISVCLKCGKIKKSYDIDKCKDKVGKLYKRYKNQYDRKCKMDDILNGKS